MLFHAFILRHITHFYIKLLKTGTVDKTKYFKVRDMPQSYNHILIYQALSPLARLCF